MRLINISERGKVCFLLWTLGHDNQFYDFEYKGAPKWKFPRYVNLTPPPPPSQNGLKDTI